VDFVDKTDDPSRLLVDVFQQSFEALLELASDARTGEKGGEVEGEDAFVEQGLAKGKEESEDRWVSDQEVWGNERGADDRRMKLEKKRRVGLPPAPPC
jgi:hypothetical protein